MHKILLMKIESAKISVWTGKWLMRSSMGGAIGNRWVLGERVTFLKQCSFWEATHAPVDALTLMYLQAALNDSVNVKQTYNRGST